MLETNRLILIPLTYEQLVKHINNDGSLEEELKTKRTCKIISPELKDALETKILPSVADPTKNYLYCTIWTAISKANNQMVGDLCFKGEPDAQGAVEIGYGTYDEFQNKGYMTEMVNAIIHWSKSEHKITAICASTGKTNRASIRVLEKNGFMKIDECDDYFNWKLYIES